MWALQISILWGHKVELPGSTAAILHSDPQKFQKAMFQGSYDDPRNDWTWKIPSTCVCPCMLHFLLPSGLTVSLGYGSQRRLARSQAEWILQAYKKRKRELPISFILPGFATSLSAFELPKPRGMIWANGITLSSRLGYPLGAWKRGQRKPSLLWSQLQTWRH